VMAFAQKLRNSIAHDGAITRTGILEIWSALTPTQQQIWTEDAGSAPELVQGARIPLGPGEVRATLAVTTVLARAVNDELGRMISRERWVGILVDDWRNEHPEKWRDWERRSRNACGWARHHYGPLAITVAEIDAVIAARRGGLGS